MRTFDHTSKDKSETISIRISSDLLDLMKRIARKRASKEDVDINYRDLIRDALNTYDWKLPDE